MTIERFETEYSGKRLIVETGRLAHQAGAAVTARIGDTMVLATATMSGGAKQAMDYFPLMVDYEERYAAAGKIKGPKFMKREGRPSSEAILIGRMIDRGMRPLFPDGLRNEVQIVILPLSIDSENRPDIVGMIAATMAVEISNIPFDGPISGLRVGLVNGEFVANPSVEEIEFSELNLVVMGDGNRITMVDCDARELDDDYMLKAFQFAMDSMAPLTEFMKEVKAKVGKPKAAKEELVWAASFDEEEQKVIEKVKKLALPQLDKFLFNTPKGSKGERKRIVHELESSIVEELGPKLKVKDLDEGEVKDYVQRIMDRFFYDFIEDQVTQAILDRDQRVDGRRLDEIRPLSAEVGVVPRSHGTGLFSRGETQILSFVTLGAPGDDLFIETMESDQKKKYFHHYNFLPFSVGEVKPLRGAGRREIGHGALAEKALLPVLPRESDFPYTIRVVSEVMGSNGSSSMGSTVGSTLALMDAGVPIKKPVAGIAMGLASDGSRWKVLTDLQDMEDGKGGMDFKFTSTKDGITAIQMDTKTRGLTREMIVATFPQMRKALEEVLAVITNCLPEPRKELSQFAPRIIAIKIDPEKIGEVIGPGGKVIRGMCEEYDVQIDVQDDGTVTITSTNMEAAKKAEKAVRDIVRTLEVGEIFDAAKVVKIMPFGAFVELTGKTDGLLHVSEIDWVRVEKVTDRLSVGDKVRVKVIGIDRGKVEVSMKVLLPRPDNVPPSQPRRSGPPGPKRRRPQGNRDGKDRSRPRPERR
jgi:polyribonucleotide nucleotidyltransferase